MSVSESRGTAPKPVAAREYVSITPAGVTAARNARRPPVVAKSCTGSPCSKGAPVQTPNARVGMPLEPIPQRSAIRPPPAGAPSNVNACAYRQPREVV